MINILEQFRNPNIFQNFIAESFLKRHISFNFMKQIKIVTIDKLTIAALSFITIQKVINCRTAVVNLTTTISMNNISNIFYGM